MTHSEKWSHRALLDDLAEAQDSLAQVQQGKRVVLSEFTLGPTLSKPRGQKPGRVDVMVLHCAYKNMNPAIYDVKVSRADLTSDIREGKYTQYLNYCSRFYFAVPAGLCQKDELPADVGLIVRGDRGWTTVKGAKRQANKDPLSYDVLQAAVFAAHATRRDLHRRRVADEARELARDRDQLRRLGQQLLPEDLARCLLRAKMYDNLVAELSELLGIPSEGRSFISASIIGEVKRQLNQPSDIARTQAVSACLMYLKKALDGQSVPVTEKVMDNLRQVVPDLPERDHG